MNLKKSSKLSMPQNTFFSVAEYTDDYGRQQLYISGWVTWVFGTAALALIAWATAEWFSYELVTTLVNVIFIPFFL